MRAHAAKTRSTGPPNIAELHEKKHAKRSPDGSPDDGWHHAAPTGGPPNAHAVRPEPRSQFEDFFGCRTTAQSQAGRQGGAAGPAGRVPDSTPRARCQRHPLFEAELPYDLSDARLQVVLTMLTTHELSLFRGHAAHFSGQRRRYTDQDSAAVTFDHFSNMRDSLFPRAACFHHRQKRQLRWVACQGRQQAAA